MLNTRIDVIIPDSLTAKELEAIEINMRKGYYSAQNKIIKTYIETLVSLGISEAEAKEFTVKNILSPTDTKEAIDGLFDFGKTITEKAHPVTIA